MLTLLFIYLYINAILGGVAIAEGVRANSKTTTQVLIFSLLFGLLWLIWINILKLRK